MLRIRKRFTDSDAAMRKLCARKLTEAMSQINGSVGVMRASHSRGPHRPRSLIWSVFQSTHRLFDEVARCASRLVPARCAPKSVGGRTPPPPPPPIHRISLLLRGLSPTLACSIRESGEKRLIVERPAGWLSDDANRAPSTRDDVIRRERLEFAGIRRTLRLFVAVILLLRESPLGNHNPARKGNRAVSLDPGSVGWKWTLVMRMPT